MGPKELRAYCKPSDEVKALLRAAIQQLGLSARAYDRLLKVSRTIADLEGTKDIQVAHVGEAIQYRSLDRKFLGRLAVRYWMLGTERCLDGCRIMAMIRLMCPSLAYEKRHDARLLWQTQQSHSATGADR